MPATTLEPRGYGRATSGTCSSVRSRLSSLARYFDSATVSRVLASLERALASTGTLVLGAADALCATAARMADAGTLGGAPAPSPSRPLRRPLGRLPVPDVAAADPHDAADYFQRGLEAHERHEALLGQVDLADIAAAARARLDVLAVGAAPGRVS